MTWEETGWETLGQWLLAIPFVLVAVVALVDWLSLSRPDAGEHSVSDANPAGGAEPNTDCKKAA